ncbi:MAG: condensation domain-containing protein, partial [Acidobacteriota bacterium]
MKKRIEAIYPLSPQQQGMLFETLYAPDSGIHVEQVVCALREQLDPTIFKLALQRLVERHSILRTAFVWKDQDEPYQVILQQVEVPIEHQDWRTYPQTEHQERLEAYLETDRRRGFELSKAPLMRLSLVQIDEHHYYFVWTCHHILMDGWCEPLLIKEFLSFYQALRTGQELQLPPCCSYSDYLLWLKKQDLTEAELFWRKTLENFTSPTQLGIATMATLLDQQERYGEQKFHLSAQETAALQSLAQLQRVTLNTILQAVWALLLSRYSNTLDVVFGITVSGRPADLVGVDSLIGLFINTLPIRIKLSAERLFCDWL